MGACASAVKDGFAEPTKERLNDLGPGCYVQKMDVCGSCCWAEIVSGNDSGYECIAHPALSDGAAQEGIAEGSSIVVQREQITALGCDRYCSC